jgi:hypothetical protein
LTYQRILSRDSPLAAPKWERKKSRLPHTDGSFIASNEEQEDGGKVFARYCSWTLSIIDGN